MPTASDRRIVPASSYILPALLLLLSLPLTLYAARQSLDWIGRPFPGFLLMENRVVPSVSGYDWPQADIFHSQVLAIDGEPVSSVADIYARVAGRPPGSTFEYDLLRGGERFRVSLPSRIFQWRDYVAVYGILLLIALINLVLGGIVGFLQPARREAKAYVWLSFAGCLFAATPVFLHRPGFHLLTVCYLAAESFFPATFIYFGLWFPVERRFRAGWRGIRGSWIEALPFVIAGVLTAVKLEGFFRDPPDLRGLYASYVFIAASFLFFLGGMIQSWWQERDPQAQLRVRTLLPGVVLGTVLAVFAFLENSLSGGRFPMQLGLLLVPLFYASVAYAIVAHDLFGIDRFVRWTFVYGGLSLVVYSLYSLLVASLPSLALRWGASKGTVLGIGFIALAILLDPLRRLVQRVVDRAYFRLPWSYRETIGRISREMTGWRSVERIAGELTRVLTAEMQLETVTICLLDGSRPWSRRADGPLARLADQPALRSLEGRPRVAGELLAAGDILEGDGAELAPLFGMVEATLVLPLVFDGRTTGLMLLGPTRARRALSGEDLELLRTLASQAAIALENARSYETLEAHNRDLDETVRRRTAQLIQSEQLASLGQLVAGVAHELNNPVGAVYSSVENLRDTLGEVSELLRQLESRAGTTPEARARIEALRTELGLDAAIEESQELLAICSEGSERIRGIVRDLLTFARGDRGERVPTDVREGLDSTLHLLADRCDRARIRIVCDYQAAPLIPANPAQLNQVWMNVLTNAIDALADGETGEREIRVRLRPVVGDRGRGVEVEIRDTGSGMSAEVKARLFEPFFTTKEIGKGTGLGLSIAYGIVRQHGGAILVESTPGDGTTLRVSLPADPTT